MFAIGVNFGLSCFEEDVLGRIKGYGVACGHVGLLQVDVTLGTGEVDIVTCLHGVAHAGTVGAVVL